MELDNAPTTHRSPWKDLYDLRKKMLSVQRFNSDALFSWYAREGAMDTKRYELFVHQGECEQRK